MRWQRTISNFLNSSIIGKVCCIVFFITTGTWFARFLQLNQVSSLNTEENDALNKFTPSYLYQNKTFPMDFLNTDTKKLVHLDLKGAPAKLSYLEELLPVLKKWGATGLLMEYEDTFPYWGADLSVVGSSGPDSPGVYSRQEIEEFLNFAAQHDLEIIPLVQTFGHFEFVLKHDEFRGLREVENFPSSLCPSKPGTLSLVQAMLTQVLELHPGIQTLHIGADEVWHMGLCDACRERMNQMPQINKHVARDRLFLEHVTSVLHWLRTNYPSLQLLMWDDMLRHMDPILLQEFDLGKLVEPMVWHYRPSKTFHLPHDLWSKYSSVFNGVWIATAFKGASGSNALLPDVSQHLDCQERWIQELRVQHEKGTLPKLRGIVITGWSRYDHYAVMCELLPTGLPSLALCLAHWKSGAFTPEVHSQVSHLLGYPKGELIPLLAPLQHALSSPSLNFPGWKILSGIQWLVALQVKIDSVIASEQLLDELAAVERLLKPALETMMPPLPLEEWLGTTLEPRRERLRTLLHEAERQVALGGRIRGYQITA